MDFVVLSSSRGTTFQSVIDRIANGSLHARCLGLVTDQRYRECIDKAEAAGLPVAVAEKVKSEARETYDRKVDAAIRSLIEEQRGNPETTLLAAMGWMWIMTPWLIHTWQNRILNVHPALLPKYGGKGMYGDHVHEAVLAAREKESGITIHLMDEGVDTGQILLQKHCAIEPAETIESLKAKVQGLEKEWYPKVLEMIHTGELTLPS